MILELLINNIDVEHITLRLNRIEVESCFDLNPLASPPSTGTVFIFDISLFSPCLSGVK